MKILFDSESSQMQVQEETGTRLNTLFGAIKSEGWTWEKSLDPITAEKLQGYNILAILTRHKATKPGTKNPFPPDQSFAYTAEEVSAVESFVKAGGGLLLISNHDSWCDNDRVLAAAFGVTMEPAYFRIPGKRIMTISGEALNPELQDSILREVASLMAHNSCAISVPAGTKFTPIASIPSDAVDRSSPRLPVADHYFALALQHGEGKVIVAGNSGITGDDGSAYPAAGLIPYGNNLMFLLNTLKYLGNVPKVATEIAEGGDALPG